MVLPMTSVKGTVHVFNDLSFETTRNDAHENVLISFWETVLNKERALITARVAATVLKEVRVEYERSPNECRRTKNGDAIAREAKSITNVLFATELRIMIF